MQPPQGDDAQDRSLGELTKQLAQDVSTLARQEIELAKAELTQKGKTMGLGAGMFGGAYVAGMMALGALTACLILALAIVIPASVAAIIVAIVWGAVAGILALQGRKKVREGPLPSRNRP